jgi:hypothetical protein
MAAEVSSTLKIDLFSFRDRVLDRLGTDPDLSDLLAAQQEKIRSAVTAGFSEVGNAVLIADTFQYCKESSIRFLGFEEEEIARKVSKVFDQEFGKVRQTSQADVTALKSVYGKFLMDLAPFKIPYAEQSHDRWFKDVLFDWNDVDLQSSPEEIESIYKQFKVVLVRPIDPEARTLLIGCGNGKFSDEGNRPLYDEYYPYSLAHNHPSNMVTVDLDLSANPTILAPFGLFSIAGLFGAQKFDHIILEGTFGYRPSDQGNDDFSVCGLEDVQQLLAPSGKVSFWDEGEETDVTADMFGEPDVSKPAEPSSRKRKASAAEPKDIDDDDEKAQGMKALLASLKKPKTTNDGPSGNNS